MTLQKNNRFKEYVLELEQIKYNHLQGSSDFIFCLDLKCIFNHGKFFRHKWSQTQKTRHT